MTHTGYDINDTDLIYADIHGSFLSGTAREMRVRLSVVFTCANML